MATLAVTRPAPRHTVGGAVARFFERRLRHVEGPLAGRPLLLEGWQQEDLDLIYEVDEDGHRVWRKVLWGQARGNGKTPVMGGIALVELTSGRDAPKVFIGAGARDQAKIANEFVKGTIKAGPLKDYLVPQANAVLYPQFGGSMRVLSADGDLQHGLNVSFGGLDELHVFHTRKQQELYFAIDTALKRPWSWRMAITTAGWDKQTLLGEMYDAALQFPDIWVSPDGCLTIAMNREAQTLMIWRGLPDDADPADEDLWRAVNPASWVTMDYLRMQARSLPEGVFRRLHLNQWTGAQAGAITAESWDASWDPSAEIPEGARVVIAVAMTEMRDAGTVAIMTMGDQRTVSFIDVEADPGAPSAEDAVMTVVRDACARYQHRCLVYSPLHFASAAERLSREGVRLYRGPKASKPGFSEADMFMVPASQDLIEHIGQGQIRHNADALIRRQVLAAETKIVQGTAWRVVRPSAAGQGKAKRAEAAFALLMADSVATEPEPYIFAGVW